jgi:hypothetical protein
MEVVAQATLHPGTCVITKSGTGPFVDTHRENLMGERCYLSVEFVRELAATIGCRMPEEQRAIDIGTVRLQQRVAELEAVERELDALRAAVRTTLAQGALRVERHGETVGYELRGAPGIPKPDLSKEASVGS